jgi:hypothetical protein
MNKQKVFNFLNKILYSSLFLWVLLIILKRFNLKPEINVNLFFFLSIFLFSSLYLRQILIFLILALNKINIFLGISKETVTIKSQNIRYLFPLFILKFLKFLKGFPRFLKFIFTNYFFWFGLCILGIFLDIFIFKFTSDLLISFLAILLFLSFYRRKFDGRISIKIALFFLILCPLSLIFNEDLRAEKLAIWVYVFSLIGSIQIFIDNFKEIDRYGNKKE